MYDVNWTPQDELFRNHNKFTVAVDFILFVGVLINENLTLADNIYLSGLWAMEMLLNNPHDFKMYQRLTFASYLGS